MKTRFLFRITRCCFVLLAAGLGACSRASYPLQYQSAPLVARSAAAPTVGAEAPPATADTLAAVVVAPAARRHLAQQPSSIPLRAGRQLAILAHPLPRLRAGLATAQYQPAPPDQPTPVRYRSRSIAFLLALPMLGLGLLGLHLFYLGYQPRATSYFLTTLVGLIVFIIAIPSNSPMLALVGAAALGVVYLLALTDVVRILTGDLKPKEGAYYPHFFQVHPKAALPKP